MIKKRRSFLILAAWAGIIGLSTWLEVSAEIGKPAGPTAPIQAGQPAVNLQAKADLELTNIWVNDQCHPRIQVTNKGVKVFDYSTPCMLNYYVDGNLFAPISGCSGKNLNPGESYTFEFTASSNPGPGTHMLKAVVDANNQIMEKDESNNSKEVQVTCGRVKVPNKAIQKK